MLALTHGYKVRVLRPYLPLLSLTLHLDAAHPPCPSPRSPPSRSPAIASAAVHVHIAAPRAHGDSTQSPSPLSTLTLPCPRVHRRATPTPHQRAHRRVACMQLV
ncbi:hypothetical protein B0H16DRAFT_1745228 [Mycena metata]|uniref:Uncharacterized protein n=1 Tax=Mycena metata TaxID=1033252 RepID=A0AAD7H4H9_9AGAR|nr:hypothetical protein B0H16DRAFT_1745228 [Mycena metata]